MRNLAVAAVPDPASDPADAAGAAGAAAEPMGFDAFVRDSLPALLRFAGVLTGERQLAEDIAQDVLIKAMNAWDRIGDLDRPGAYVRRMIVNEFVSWRRKWARIVPSERLTGESAHTGAHPSLVSVDHAQQLADRAELAHQLRRLPPRQRAVVVLRFYEDLSFAEIADILGCSEGTVRGYNSRALHAMQIDLQTDLRTDPTHDGSTPR